MSEFLSLTCPNCGGKLEITKEIERFTCGYCGIEHIVQRGGGIITLAPVVKEVKAIRISVDKTASELAIKRLEQEVIDQKKIIQEFERIEVDKIDIMLVVFLFIGVCVFIVGCWSSLNSQGLGFLVVMAIGLILVLLAVFLIKHEMKGIKAAKQRRLEKLRVHRITLEQKENELNHHKKIVEIEK